MALSASTGVLAAGQRHSLKHFLRAEFGLLVGLFWGLPVIEGVLLFGRRTVLMSHRNISGLLAPRKNTRKGWEVGARSVQQSFVHLLTDLGMRDPARRPDQQIT